MRPKVRRPSHGTTVAYVALFAALGGGAYAAGNINGSSLADRSVGGRKLKLDTVTGAEVKESKLVGVVKGRGRLLLGRTTGASGAGVLKTFTTPVGQFRLRCTATQADARYINTTGGSADVFRAFVGSGTFNDNTDFDVVPHNGDVGYSVTDANGPEFMDMRAGKGPKLAILRVGERRTGTGACIFNWEFAGP